MIRPSPPRYLFPILLAFPLLTFPISHPFPLQRSVPIPGHRPLTRGQVFLVPTTYGGIGNQIYFLLEAIHIAYVTNVTLILPPSPPRNLPNRSVTTASHNIDQHRLSSLAKLTDKLPEQCHNSFAHIIRAHRRKNTPSSLSSRVLTIACYFTNLDTDTNKCGQQALRTAKQHDFHLPLSREPSLSLHNLLPKISGCVLLDGHSYNRAGDHAQEALHSYLHYLEPSKTIRDISATFHADIVVHLRYDEHECFRKQVYQPGLVCVRTRLSTHQGVMQFVKPQVFIDTIVEEAMRRQLQSLYLAFSPYVPDDMVQTLQLLFQKQITLVPRIQGYEHNVENLVERRLATNAKLFVGDFASTWSGTVYYKRRTLDRTTVWTCRLLDLCSDLGYYRFEGRLRPPEWFQSTGVL